MEELRNRVKHAGATEPSAVLEILKEILTGLLGEESALDLSTRPSLVLVIGVNGVGKTTTIGKMAHYLTGEGKTVLLAAADTFRAAAADQLAIWADRAGVGMIRHEEGSDPASVVYDAIAAGRSRGVDVIICDTAGRLHNKKNLMDELSKITRVIARELPEAAVEVLLVLDATTARTRFPRPRASSRLPASPALSSPSWTAPPRAGPCWPSGRSSGCPSNSSASARASTICAPSSPRSSPPPCSPRRKTDEGYRSHRQRRKDAGI